MGGLERSEFTQGQETSEMANIPLVDLKANYASIKDEIDAGIGGVLESCYFVNGPEVKKFEQNYATWCGTKHAIALNSGTDALILACKFLGIGPGDQVICPANTFVATCLGPSNNGADVVLVDHDEHYTIDPTRIEAKITEQTKAIIAVHLYGQCCDMDPIIEIAKRHNLVVIEDAAQAHGAVYKGKRAGSMGDVGCFSFYPGKNLGAFGDGGAVVTNNDEFAEKLTWWRSWGAAKKYHHEIKGGNSRLDAMQAAVLDAKLGHMDEWNAARRSHASAYSEKLACLGDKIKLPKTAEYGEHVWHLFVIQAQARDELLSHLNSKGIGAGIHYPIPIHKLGAYEELAKFEAELPNTNDAASRLLSLPMFPELTEEQIDRVVSEVLSFYGSQ